MNRAHYTTLLLNGTLLILLALLPLLIIATIQRPALNRLHSNIQALRPGMSISQVQHHMGSKPN